MIYYISNSGSDLSGGTSTATAWQTINKLQQALSAGIIQPGDEIKFRNGDTFVGKLLWIRGIWGYNHPTGTSLNKIKISSYSDPSAPSVSKPVFHYPPGGSIPAADRILFWFAGVDYIEIENLEFSDPDTTNDKITPANCGTPIKFGSDGEAVCNHCSVKNVKIRYCGMGIVIIGDYNIMESNYMSDFKNLTSTPSYINPLEDVGATSFTITGSFNTIKKNYIRDAWAESLDYGFNGNCVEMYNQSSNNLVMGNIFIDCGNGSEYGSTINNPTPASNNIMCYNIFIDCGSIIYCNIGGVFAMEVANLKFYNNIVIETANSRFSDGPNFGLGISTPEAISKLSPDEFIFSCNIAPSAPNFLDIKNNFFYLSGGMSIIRDILRSKITANNNVYTFESGCDTNYSNTPGTIFSLEQIFTGPLSDLFENTSGPIYDWDFRPKSSSILLNNGVNVGLINDFYDNIVGDPPEIGISEYLPSGLVAVANSTPISCNGGTSLVTISGVGGTPPYTGVGIFVVGAGTHNYTITDSLSQTANVSINITQPDPIVVSYTYAPIEINGNKTTIIISGIGGTGLYEYKIGSGPYQSSSSFPNVGAGTYLLYVRDENGCVGTTNITITQPDPLTATYTILEYPLCYGGSTTIMVTCFGGTEPYSRDGTWIIDSDTGSHRVEDAAGAVFIIPINVPQPEEITANATFDEILDFGDVTTVIINASGGTGTLQYSFNGSPFTSSNVFTGIPAGSYYYSVTDENGCTSTFNLDISQPDPLSLTVLFFITKIKSDGSNATVEIQAYGGVPPYTGTGVFIQEQNTKIYTITDSNSDSITTSITLPAHDFIGKDTGILIVRNLMAINSLKNTDGDSVVLSTDEEGKLVMVPRSSNSGIYSPNLDNTINVDSLSLVAASWSRIKNIVTVNFTFDCTPTAAGVVEVDIELPFSASDLDSINGNVIATSMSQPTGYKNLSGFVSKMNSNAATIKYEETGTSLTRVIRGTMTFVTSDPIL